MNSKRNLTATAFSFLLVSIAASCGCMCTPGVCNPHDSSRSGTQHVPCDIAHGCARPMPVGYYPTTWEPLLAISTDHSYEPQVKEVLPPGTQVPEKPDKDREVPTKPDAPKPESELGTPLPDKLGMRYDDFDPHRIGGRRWRTNTRLRE